MHTFSYYTYTEFPNRGFVSLIVISEVFRRQNVSINLVMACVGSRNTAFGNNGIPLPNITGASRYKNVGTYYVIL